MTIKVSPYLLSLQENLKLMLTKDHVRKSVERLPEKFTIDEIVGQLIILNKIEEGLKDIEEGRVYSTEQVEQKLKKWLK